MYTISRKESDNAKKKISLKRHNAHLERNVLGIFIDIAIKQYMRYVGRLQNLSWIRSNN